MIRLRQIVFAAPDLTAATEELVAVFGLGEPFHDPGVAEFGLVNAVYPVGEQFVEIVSPDPASVADSAVDRFIERNHGPGGYMLIFQTDRDLDSVRSGLDGVRIVYEAIAPGIVGLHLHPADVGGAIVSIDRTDDWAEWPWAGPGWRDRVGGSPAVSGIAGVVMASPDPAALAERWRDWFGGDLDGTNLMLDDDTQIAFTEGDRGDGRAFIAGFRFRAAAHSVPVDTDVAGVRCVSG